ncbi:MAG: tetratricopeptide repeat protein [Caulobacter sp.]|nr:tetratricopeptide repeat protein [Caulobacter sp.]
MCRMLALAATILTLLAAPAFAAPATTPTAAPAPAGPAPRVKATPAQRAEAARVDPLARAAFWARELEIDARDTQAGLGLAMALRQLGRYPEAADAAGQVLVIEPENIDALLEAARAQIGRGQGFYAIEPARHAQALAPRDWRPVALLAVAYEQADRDDEALAAHRQALALAPSEPAVLANLAMYYAGHGDFAQAEQLLRRAVTLPRADARVRQNLALVVGLQGRLPEAEQLVRQDLPPDQAANNIAWLKAATARAPTGEGRSWSAVTGGGS